MANAPVVQPVDPNQAPTPQPAPAGAPPANAQDPSQTPTPQDDELPHELLKIPAIQGMLAGKPAAVSGNIKDFGNREEAKEISKNKDWLLKAGFGFYKSLSGHLGVLYNSFFVHPEDLQAADKTGVLATIAPPFDAVNHQLSKAGPQHPVLGAKTPSALAQASPAATAPPQSGSGLMAALAPSPMAGKASSQPVSVQRKAQTARLANVAPGAPTSGPSPGSGRILNSLLKTPV